MSAPPLLLSVEVPRLFAGELFVIPRVCTALAYRVATVEPYAAKLIGPSELAMRALKAVVSFLVVIFLVGACTLLGSDDEGLPPGEYEGFYAFGWEINDFRPCNRDEDWWVTGKEKTLLELHERHGRVIQESDGGRVYVRLRGNPSKEGKFGEREFDLSKVIEVRAAVEEDCQ